MERLLVNLARDSSTLCRSALLAIYRTDSMDVQEKILSISKVLDPSVTAAIALQVFSDSEMAGLIQRSVAESAPPAPKLQECPVCLEDCEALHATTFACSHKCCWNCIKNHTKYVLDTRSNVVRCPMCPNKVEKPDDSGSIPTEALGLVDPLLFIRAAQAESELESEIVQRFQRSWQLQPFLARSQAHGQCPMCRTWSPLPHHSLYTRCASAKCAYLYCQQCLCEVHIGKTCAQASGTARAVESAESLKIVEGCAKKCPRCQSRISHPKQHGCHHIRCSRPNCGYEFCYVCLGPWDVDSADPCQCGLYCFEGCGCIPCGDCSQGKPCAACSGDCDVCTGRRKS